MEAEFMRLAIAEAIEGVSSKHGGPFGAVIVRGGAVVARAHNTVLRDNDPTAHGEVNAIRAASRALGRFDLSDCELYTTAEPCPMCLAAIVWSGIRAVYYGCSADDTAAIGFADRAIYDLIRGQAGPGGPRLQSLLREECLPVFGAWTDQPDRVMY